MAREFLQLLLPEVEEEDLLLLLLLLLLRLLGATVTVFGAFQSSVWEVVTVSEAFRSWVGIVAVRFEAV